MKPLQFSVPKNINNNAFHYGRNNENLVIYERLLEKINFENLYAKPPLYEHMIITET